MATTLDEPIRCAHFRPTMNLFRLAALFVALCFAGAQDTASSLSCDLQCQNGGTCATGEADYSSSMHPVDALNGTSTDLANQSSVNGMHCSCPDGFTGTLCDVAYESCNQDTHPCYNNGKCVPGLVNSNDGSSQLEQLYICNCADAVVNGVQYAGKYCEHAANDYCDDAKTIFCIHGSCNRDYPSGGGPCVCQSGYSGSSCQYEDGSVPECDLTCQNGGVCTFDYSGDEPAYMYWESNGTAKHESMTCTCPDGYKGRLCDVKSVPCGDSWCFHGGTCLEHSINGKVQYDCDCTTTYTDQASYAGTMCQFAATSYCTKASGGANGNLFCTNHGRCSDDPVQGCECDDPYTGYSCEFILEDLAKKNSTAAAGDVLTNPNGTADDVWLGDDKNMLPLEPLSGDVIFDTYDDIKCNLKCKNGGTCQVGVKDNGVLEGIANDTAPTFNLTDDSEESFMHCICPDGYYGNLCESLVSICGDNEHMCLNGGKCVQYSADQHACDCNPNPTNDEIQSVLYAGNSCEHVVNRQDICNDEAYASMETSPVSFCVHGTCKQRVTAGQSHPGCYCDTGFTGPHCEIRETLNFGNASAAKSSSSSLPIGQILAIVGVLLAATLVAALVGSAVRRKRRKRKDLATSMLWGDSLYRDGYRDEPGSGINIAPRRSSAVYEDAISAQENSVGMHSSSTDPMATVLAPKALVAPLDVDDEEEPEPQPTVYIGPPRDEDGHVLHNVEIC